MMMMALYTMLAVCSVDWLIFDNFISSCLVKAMRELGVAVDVLSLSILMLIKRLMVICNIIV